VTKAIARAAKSTGANFDYLLATAKVESDLDPNLTMRTSTATGLFQFLEQTWLGVMKTAGRAFGFAQYADAISQTSSGHYVVDDPKLRAEMMKLRKDPTANAVMGGVITQQNAAVLGNRIGRKPTEGELYVAHFFGPYAAAKVIALAATNPNANAAAMFPAAARANRSIFYDRQGNARTIAGVQNELVRRYQVAKARSASLIATAGLPATPSAPPAASSVAPPTAPVRTGGSGVPDTAGVTQAIAAAQTPRAPEPTADSLPLAPLSFHSLFENEERRGALFPLVADLWASPRAAPRVAPVEPASGAPLDLFQDSPPSTRGLFKGGA